MKIKINLLKSTFFILLLIFSGVLNAQLKEINPEQEGFSQERLNRLTSMIDGFTANHNVSGVVSLVTRNGKIVYYKTSGYSDISKNKKMQENDLFRIASQTKAITGVGIMILYEQGKLLLNDPLSKYAPEFKNMTVIDSVNLKDTTFTSVPAKREITIQDLLTHTSGFGYPGIGTPIARAIYAKANIPNGLEDKKITVSDAMKKLATIPLMHQPGAQFTYGLSIDVLGYVIEKITGESLKDFFEKNIFTPLGMKDTYFYLPKSKQSRLVTVYDLDASGKKISYNHKSTMGVTVDYPLITDGTYYSGGGGLSSTAMDYSIFLTMLANEGKYNGVRILSPSSVRLMSENEIDKEKTKWTSDNDFGYTFEISTINGDHGKPWGLGTYSWGGYWGTHFWVDPVNHITVQIMTNDAGPKRAEMVQKFRAMLYSALVKP